MGRTPSSRYKVPILRDLFFKKFDPENPQDRIIVPITEVVDCADKYGYRPGNIHNFFKDLVRTGKTPKGVADIAELGYQIVQTDGGGEFVRLQGEIDAVGLSDDLPAIEIGSNGIPKEVYDLVRTDEGGALSVVEYCGILDLIAGAKVFRVQSPVKVAPNEIDGLYVYEKEGKRTIFTAEAKSKGSDVILKHQIYGAAEKALKFFGEQVDRIVPLGIKIARDNTIYVAVFQPFTLENPKPEVHEIFRYKIDPIPQQWIRKSKRKKMVPKEQLPLPGAIL
jgi:hypothetical protein